MNYLGSKRIATKRLELRSQTMDEQKYLWDLLMIPEVNRYFLSVPRKFIEKIKDWSIQEGIYQEKMKHANDSNVFEWSIFLKDTKECIGRIVCQEIDSNSPDIRDVGWLIDPIHQNKGYVTEAATSMLEFMFNDCDITAIHTGAAIENLASWKVMEKLGFIRQDEIVWYDYTFLDEPIQGYKYYLTKEQFLNREK